MRPTVLIVDDHEAFRVSDIRLPDLDGFTVAERLAEANEPPAIVLICSREAEAYGPRLEAAPAQGFIPKRELSGAALAREEVAVGEADSGEERPRGRAQRRHPGHDLDGDPVLGQGRDRLVRELRPRRPSTKRLLAVKISEAILSDPNHLAYPSQPARSSIETPSMPSVRSGVSPLARDSLGLRRSPEAP